MIKYMFKFVDMFPNDLDDKTSLTLQSIPDPALVFRPEFTQSYDQFLSADCLKLNTKFARFPHEDKENLRQASEFLKNRVIIELVAQLNDLTLLPKDCMELTRVMHEHGVNIRYLHHIYVLTPCQHVKDLCLTAMTARTIKNMMNQRLADLVLSSKREFSDLE